MVKTIKVRDATRERIETFRENPYEPVDVILVRIMDRAEGKA